MVLPHRLLIRKKKNSLVEFVRIDIKTVSTHNNKFTCLLDEFENNNNLEL